MIIYLILTTKGSSIVILGIKCFGFVRLLSPDLSPLFEICPVPIWLVSKKNFFTNLLLQEIFFSNIIVPKRLVPVIHFQII
jgi:hypothetical protein